MIMKLCLLLIFASSYASSQACVMPSEIPDSIQSSIFTQRLWDEYRRNQTRQIRAHGGCLNSPVSNCPGIALVAEVAVENAEHVTL